MTFGGREIEKEASDSDSGQNSESKLMEKIGKYFNQKLVSDERM